MRRDYDNIIVEAKRIISSARTDPGLAWSDVMVRDLLLDNMPHSFAVIDAVLVILKDEEFLYGGAS